MLYNDSEKWAFVHVPKNAGTAITLIADKIRRKNKAIKWMEMGNFAHHNKWSYWSKIPEFFKDYTQRFAPILRNPWDRALSIYTYNLKNTAKNLTQEWGKEDHARLIKEGFKRSWMPGGFFVDNYGKEFEYNKQTGRAWGQDDDQFSWLDGEGKWFRLEDGN